MSRHPALAVDDRPDPVELADLTDRPSRSELHADDVEPHDFDDHRIAERFGQQGGHFAFEAADEVEDFGMGEW
jgi:hypothetical protein